jgi:hypothetical protein
LGRRYLNQTRKRDAWGTKRPSRRPESEWVRLAAPDLQIIPDNLWQAAEARRARARQTFVRTATGTLLGRPSVDDFESPYLLSGLARCATCGGALVGLTRAHGRGRRPLYGCAYHHKRGATVCPNNVEIRQEILETAFLDALHAVLDQRIIEDAVREALVRLRRDGDQRLGQRGALERERSLVEARTRHLLEAVKAGYATTALLQELEREEARKSAIAAELAGSLTSSAWPPWTRRASPVTWPGSRRTCGGSWAGRPARPGRCSASSSPGIGSSACRSWTRTAPGAITSGRRGRTRPYSRDGTSSTMGVSPTGLGQRGRRSFVG